MFRRVIAGLFLGPALLIGSFAWTGFIATRTVFDPDRSTTIAHELLDNDEVRAQLADNLGSAVEAAVPEDVSVDSSDVESAAERILADPEVERLIIEAFSSTHHAFLGEGDAPRTLDLTPLASMVRSEIVATVPSLDQQLPPAAPLVVTLPTDQIPNAGPVDDFLRKAVPFLAAMSVVGVLIALLATTDRSAVLKRAAGWAIGTTAVYLIIGLGIPELLQRFAPDQAKVIAALLSALLRSTLIPSIILAVVGAGLLIAAYAWPDGPRSTPEVAAAPQQRRPVRTPIGAQPPQDSWPTMPTAQPAQVSQPPQAASSAVPPSAAPTRVEPTRVEPPVAKPSVVESPVVESPVVADFAPLASSSLPAPPVAPAETPEPDEAAGPGPQILPTRAHHHSPVDLPAWTGESEGPVVLPPRWVEGHGWVLDPNDQRPPPPNARWVEGVGHIVPGPPPQR